MASVGKAIRTAVKAFCFGCRLRGGGEINLQRLENVRKKGIIFFLLI